MRRVTKENLIAQIDRLRKIKDEQGQLSMNDEYMLQAYEMLLATMEAEPVAWTSEEAIAEVYCDETGMIGPKYMIGDVPLYRHAQPAPVVPEEMADPDESQYGGDHDEDYQAECAYVEGWNACRAVMLNQK